MQLAMMRDDVLDRDPAVVRISASHFRPTIVLYKQHRAGADYSFLSNTLINCNEFHSE